MNSPYPSQPAQKTAGIAIASLVLGILSCICFGPLTGIPAIICGHIALNRIRNSNGTLTGHGFGLAGLIIGYINLALSIVVIPLLLAIAIPNFVKARETAQTNACINNLRQLDAATEQWALENKKEIGDLVTLSDLSPYVRSVPACPVNGTYTVGPVGEPPTCSVEGHELSDY